MITATEARMKTNKYSDSVEGCLEVIYNCIESTAKAGGASLIAQSIDLKQEDKEEVKRQLKDNGFDPQDSNDGLWITW